MSGVELSIVIPAYEEGASLKTVLPVLQSVAANLSDNSEIVIVDTMAPRDDTRAICQQAGVRYVPRHGGDMYGDAVRTGFQEARGTFVVMMDGDGSHNPRALPALWQHRNEADLVIASRYVTGGQTENPAILIFMSRVVNVVFRLALGLKCYDVSNSFRLYRRDDVRRLQLECNHFDVVEEVLVKLVALRPQFRIKEVPFTFEKRKAGKTKRQLLTFILGYVATLWRLRRLKAKAKRAV